MTSITLHFENENEKDAFLVRLATSQDMECVLSKYGDNGIINATEITVAVLPFEQEE